jgi:hypothetical protein
MQDFHVCPYCSEDLEQWSVRFRRSDLVAAGERYETPASADTSLWNTSASADTLRWDTSGSATEGLTLLSLCPTDRCGYYVLRHRSGAMQWDRDVEAARLLRTLFATSDE